MFFKYNFNKKISIMLVHKIRRHTLGLFRIYHILPCSLNKCFKKEETNG